MWNPGYSFSSVVTDANADLIQSQVFKGIKNDVNLLDKYNDQETPLNIRQYREQIAQVKTLSKNLEDLSKLKTEFPVNNIASDSLALGSDSDKIAKNKQFLKRVGDDIYINQTVKIVDKMIGEEQLALRSNESAK